MTDTGPMDLLAVSKDKKELLVVELCEPYQKVRGVIIALDDDLRLQRVLSVAPNIDFYRYQIHFELLASKRGPLYIYWFLKPIYR